jgi:hypothetical protein
MTNPILLTAMTTTLLECFNDDRAHAATALTAIADFYLIFPPIFWILG